MTISELVFELKNFPADAELCVDVKPEMLSPKVLKKNDVFLVSFGVSGANLNGCADRRGVVYSVNLMLGDRMDAKPINARVAEV